MSSSPRYPGIRITTNGNSLVSYHTEVRIADGGVFYPITASTEMGEAFQLAYAEGKLNVFGAPKIAIETEGEHAAQGGAIALSLTGRRVVNFTSGQGLVYGLEQYYHAPGKLSTMVVEVAARALTRHALNVHCGHDDVYAALDTGWIMLFAKDAQQAADQAIILRRVTELSLTPGINIQDGFLTSHLERTFLRSETELIREFLGAPDDLVDPPTEAQRELFGDKRRRVPRMIDLENPILLGTVQNQEHYMNGVVARRDNFVEPILGFLEQAYREFAELTGRRYGLLSTYKTGDAETVFVSLGSAAENIEAAVDYLREKRGARVGSIHLDVIRPFPEAAVIEALAGKRQAIVLERTDEAMAGDNPMARDIRTALGKGLEAGRYDFRGGIPQLREDQLPRLFCGAYGLGSRDFRPEDVLGAYEYATGGGARQDGRKAADGEHYFVLGVDHPYAVISEERPSLLPEGVIAVRLHSIGGWGMITTGKNLGEIIGAFGEYVADRYQVVDGEGRKEALHISANPRYGSEKKGAPTAYFLVVSPERVRVNCDLRHVDAVLCCDPKAFTHTNPLEGLVQGGVFAWESDEEPEVAWQRIPHRFRREIVDKQIRLFTLPGFAIARQATDREDLQLRMQGNAFLGAFFRLSGFLKQNKIGPEHFREVVRRQYEKKFGRLGEAVVESNMRVMTGGFERVRRVEYGEIEAPDRSTMRGRALLPVLAGGPEVGDSEPRSLPMACRETFNREFRADHGYHQPASALASVGMIAAATGEEASKYVARRQTPFFIADKCTQCMECIAVCPDTALPNTAQDVGSVLRTAIEHYVTDETHRRDLLGHLEPLETRLRKRMKEGVEAAKALDRAEAALRSARRKAQKATGDEAGENVARAEAVVEAAQAIRREKALPVADLVRQELAGGFDEARAQFLEILDCIPLAYLDVHAIFRNVENKAPGEGGVFSIFVSDLCKGCAECVEACGTHEALVMRDETEELNAEHQTGTEFLRLLPETPARFLGLYDDQRPQDSKWAALRNHLMVRRNYEALASGDGACAGCGEKSVLRALASVTEAYMRPIYHAKAERLRTKADELERHGRERLARLRTRSAERHELFRKTFAHTVLGLGGESEEDTARRIEAAAKSLTDGAIVGGLAAVLRREAIAHDQLRPVDGRLANGMSVMAMGAHTGCNTVYGSTPPNNPHPYPWMNSLFQDGATISWLMGESFILDHARRSVIPERLTDTLLGNDGEVVDEEGYFRLTHMSDAVMTDREIRELPKVWALGGDGGMGDIGFQNVSKVILQNRPNVKLLMLDTQVYSNTGGQNSDSSPMLGGYDMNQLGAATQGKYTEKKGLAETFISGHGSPFVAQVSMANAAKLYKALLDGLEYRGTAFFQCFTSCQPEHGVADDKAFVQAKLARDSRCVPDLVFDPTAGETYAETLDLVGNPSRDRDWWQATRSDTKEKYSYTVAHWAATEARFRRHFKKVRAADALKPLEEMLERVTQNDVVHRRFLDPDHRAYVPDFGVTIEVDDGGGKTRTLAISRHLVLFCVERRRAWRLLQSKAGIENLDYETQRTFLERLDRGELTVEERRAGAAA